MAGWKCIDLFCYLQEIRAYLIYTENILYTVGGNEAYKVECRIRARRRGENKARDRISLVLWKVAGRRQGFKPPVPNILPPPAG